MAAEGLSHFDERGASRMVDVGHKPATHRVARASGLLTMQPQTLARVQQGEAAKGNVLEVARLAGIMAAKRTSDLIPLCHPLALTAIELAFATCGDRQLNVEARVESWGPTGVEMEALTAVAVAALTVYDMCKSMDRGISIGPIQLEEKSGGKSGQYRRGGGEST